MRNPFLKTNCYAEFSHIKSHLIWGKLTAVPNPKISVIMPVFRGGNYFEIALKSVLNQDYIEPYEVVIVDNHPVSEGQNETQKLVETINDGRILYYRHDENIGMYPNWNRGIELVRAEYFTFCHDDDILLPTALSTLMRIQNVTGQKAIFSQFNEIDSEGNLLTNKKYKKETTYKFLKHKEYFKYNLIDQFICSSGFGIGCLFNKQCMLNIGGYDQNNYPSGDFATHCAYTHFYGSVYTLINTFCYRISVNASLLQWEKFADCEKFVHECAKQFIPIPNKILDKYIEIKYKLSFNASASAWGQRRQHLIEIPVADIDRMKTLLMLRKLNKIEFCFSNK